MIAKMTAWIMSMMVAHGPQTVFIGVIIESIIVPIPSPLIIMGAGALLIEPGLTAAAALWPILFMIVLPGAAASTIGAYFAYGIAYYGGKPLIDRWGGFLGFGWADIQLMEARLMGRVEAMIFLLRALPIVPLSLISAAAGVLRLPAFSFGLWTFLGSLPRCLLLAYLGYFTRDTYEGLAKNLNTLETLVSGSIVLGSIALIIWLRARMRAAR